MREMSADLLIVGGGLGSVAAALAGARGSRSVVLTEETDWLGGQITCQAVPPDEHPWIEGFGCPLSYWRLRDGIRRYYGTTTRSRPPRSQTPTSTPAPATSAACVTSPASPSPLSKPCSPPFAVPAESPCSPTTVL